MKTRIKNTVKAKGITFYTLLGSFFTITFVCCALLFWQGFSAARNTATHMLGLYASFTDQIFSSTGSYLDHFTKMAEALSDDSAVLSIAAAELFDPDTQEAQSFFASLNYHFINALNAPYSVGYVYLKNSGFTVQAHGLNFSDDAWQCGEITEKLGLDQESWQRLCCADETLTVFIQQTDAMDFQRLFMAQEIFPGAVLIVGFSNEALTGLLDRFYLPEGSAISLITQNNLSILSSNEAGSPIHGLTFQNAESIGQGAVISSPNGDYFCYHRFFFQDTLAELILIPDTIHPDARREIRDTALIIFFVWLLLGGSCSWMLSQKLYRPIEQLLEALPLTTLERRSRSEFEQIGTAYHTLRLQNTTYENQIHSQSRILGNSLFHRLTFGGLALSPEISEALLEAGFPLQVSCFRLLHISVVAPELREEKTPDASILKEFSFSQKMEEPFVHAGRKAYFAPLDDTDYLGIFSVSQEQAAQDKACIEQLHQLLPENYPLVFFIGVSETFTSLDALPTAAAQARFALERLLLGSKTGGVQFYKKNSGLSPQNRTYMEEVHKLVSLLQLLDFEQAQRQLEHVFLCWREASSDLLAARGLSYLLDSFLLTASGLPDLCEELSQKIKEADSLYQIRDSELLKRALSALLHQIACQFADSSSDSKVRVEQIQEYIQKNFQDINLSASMVAEHFSISVSWLSVLFRKETNTGFLDYIHLTRIQKIKELLLTTPLSIAEIAERTGYASSATLLRAFKRYEGVTPGWYRKHHAS